MKLDTPLHWPARWLVAWARNWKSHALTVMIFLLAFAGIHLWQTHDIPAGKAPAFNAPATSQASSGVIQLDEWRGRHAGQAVALHFWADWCPICRVEQNSISRLQQDWPVLGVAMQSGDAARVQAVLNRRSLAWLSVVDPDGAITRRYGLSSVPAFIVLDAQGRIRFAEVGYTTEAGMRLRLWWAQTFEFGA
jgi:thiol-disulfide isomerase/thioredoxin